MYEVTGMFADGIIEVHDKKADTYQLLNINDLMIKKENA